MLNKNDITIFVNKIFGGTYILLKPPFRLTTYLLWIGPILMLFAAVFGFRKIWKTPDVEPDEVVEISREDRAMIDRILYHKD